MASEKSDKKRRRGLTDRTAKTATGTLPTEIPKHLLKWLEQLDDEGDGESTIVHFGDYDDDDDDTEESSPDIAAPQMPDLDDD